MRNLFSLFVLTLLIMACSKREQVDLIVANATIFTVDSSFSIQSAMSVRDGRIVEVGSSDFILSKYSAPQVVDAAGKFIYPGFIDAHCHFLGYGLNLSEAMLSNAKNWGEVVSRLVEFSKNNAKDWIQGRGWNQNEWDVPQFPNNDLLNQYFPTTPVFIVRIDGHAAIANNAALVIAGVTAETKVDGGEVVVSDGKPTGVLIDNAMELVRRFIPEPSSTVKQNALLKAQQNCLAVGLTGVHDAGLDTDEVLLIDSLQKADNLKIRVNAMLNPTKSNYEHFLNNGIYLTDKLTVRSVKLYADGALGSHGALLLDPYSDKPNSRGIQVETVQYLSDVCNRAYEAGYQVCTHCIGDSGVRLMLDIYGNFLKGKNTRRWRIEHSQIVHPDDLLRYGSLSVIPSVQTTHATSDMFWAHERLGERVKNAYIYQQLLQQNGWLPNGSDFPIEHINPIYGFFSGIARTTHDGRPKGGFQMENALTREQALRAMTIWAAKSSFEENSKGSLEPTKFADFVILDTDLMNAEVEKIPHAKVLSTFIAGKMVFQVGDEKME